MVVKIRSPPLGVQLSIPLHYRWGALLVHWRNGGRQYLLVFKGFISFGQLSGATCNFPSGTSLHRLSWVHGLANHPDLVFRFHPVRHPLWFPHWISPWSWQAGTDTARGPCWVFPRRIHLCPIGLVLKKNKPGKWRLIKYLSSPLDCSINDGISRERSSLSYMSVDHLAALIVSEGRRLFLVKVDIKYTTWYQSTQKTSTYWMSNGTKLFTLTGCCPWFTFSPENIFSHSRRSSVDAQEEWHVKRSSLPGQFCLCGSLCSISRSPEMHTAVSVWSSQYSNWTI